MRYSSLPSPTSDQVFAPECYVGAAVVGSSAYQEFRLARSGGHRNHHALTHPPGGGGPPDMLVRVIVDALPPGAGIAGPGAKPLSRGFFEPSFRPTLRWRRGGFGNLVAHGQEPGSSAVIAFLKDHSPFRHHASDSSRRLGRDRISSPFMRQTAVALYPAAAGKPAA